MRKLRWLLVVPAAVAIVVVALELTEQETSPDAAAGEGEPAAVEPVSGSELSLVTLSPSAAERLGLRTTPVRRSGRRTIVPYSAVLYDERGRTWVYTNPEPLSFLRAQVEIAAIRGDVATLTSGPPVGTEVVEVAAAELYGTEFEVDH